VREHLEMPGKQDPTTINREGFSATPPDRPELRSAPVSLSVARRCACSVVPKNWRNAWKRAVDILASEIQVRLELNLPCLVVTGQGSSGYKIIEEFLPEAA